MHFHFILFNYYGAKMMLWLACTRGFSKFWQLAKSYFLFHFLLFLRNLIEFRNIYKVNTDKPCELP